MVELCSYALWSQVYPASISSVSAVGNELHDGWDTSWGVLQTRVRFASRDTHQLMMQFATAVSGKVT